MIKIISVVGARPNFMKIAPFMRAIDGHNASLSAGQASPLWINHLLVHTGQHYDGKMSRDFFRSLGIPEADINLGIGSGTHAEQVGRTMIAFEQVVREHRPDWVVVVGDVNATCACSITAKKEQVKLAHIEAGLRSGDMSMPEEINPLVTDRLSDLLLAPDEISCENLRKEGCTETAIRMVGNIMIDTLEQNRVQAEALDVGQILAENRLEGAEHGARSTERGAGSTERGARSGEQGAGSGERGARSTERGAGSTEQGAGSAERGARSAERGAGSRRRKTGRRA